MPRSCARRSHRRATIAAACLSALAPAAAAPGVAHAATQTFAAVDAEQVFTVPAGVTSLHVVAIGGRGGAGAAGGGSGGFGATVTSDITVTPGEVLYIEVAGNGSDGSGTEGTSGGHGGDGGFNGGASGGNGAPGAGAGGGASDLRTSPLTAAGSLKTRLVIAAGGGGGGGAASGSGGKGGAAGQAGGKGGSDTTPAGAGKPTKGGAGGTNINFSDIGGADGGFGSGGAGGSVGPGGGGGGGGGGLYGGGGGAAGEDAGGGGGGGGGASGFGQGVTSGVIGTDKSGAPSITLSYTPPGPGAGTTTTGGNPTGNSGSSAPPAPAIARLAIAPGAFRAAPAGASAAARRRRYGAKVTYVLNVSATVRFTLVRLERGRRTKSGGCAKAAAANRHARRCTRQIHLAGSFTVAGNGGANSFRFTGRLGGKRLARGSYLLTATPSAGSRSGQPGTISFRIVR